MKQRLNKALASAGIGSRRACDAMILDGRVEVNGEPMLEPGIQVDLELDRVCVDGRRLREEKKVYYLLNKPKGFLCSQLRTEERTRLVLDLFGPTPHRLFTVGRLDKATIGMLIVTNDGEFGNRVIHPSSDLEKEYIAKVDEPLTGSHLERMRAGAYVEGRFVKPIRTAKIGKGTVKVVIKEGKRHEVRILLLKAGLKVRELKRTRIGNLRMGNLPIGHYRELGERERAAIFESSCKKMD